MPFEATQYVLMWALNLASAWGVAVSLTLAQEKIGLPESLEWIIWPYLAICLITLPFLYVCLEKTYL